MERWKDGGDDDDDVDDDDDGARVPSLLEECARSGLRSNGRLICPEKE